MIPSAVALDMTECDVVKRAGQPEQVDFGTNERSERTVVLTYHPRRAARHLPLRRGPPDLDRAGARAACAAQAATAAAAAAQAHGNAIASRSSSWSLPAALRRPPAIPLRPAPGRARDPTRVLASAAAFAGSLRIQLAGGERRIELLDLAGEAGDFGLGLGHLLPQRRGLRAPVRRCCAALRRAAALARAPAWPARIGCRRDP